MTQLCLRVTYQLSCTQVNDFEDIGLRNRQDITTQREVERSLSPTIGGSPEKYHVHTQEHSDVGKIFAEDGAGAERFDEPIALRCRREGNSIADDRVENQGPSCHIQHNETLSMKKINDERGSNACGRSRRDEDFVRGARGGPAPSPPTQLIPRDTSDSPATTGNARRSASTSAMSGQSPTESHFNFRSRSYNQVLPSGLRESVTVWHNGSSDPITSSASSTGRQRAASSAFVSDNDKGDGDYNDVSAARAGGHAAERLRGRNHCVGFLDRQKSEHLAAQREREEKLRADEVQRRKLASGGSWINRVSRTILVRSGRSSAGDEDRQSVFDRLSRTAENSMAPTEGSEAEWHRIRDDSRRQPFQPEIDRRSRFLASKMGRHDQECLEQRLFMDGDDRMRRLESRIQLERDASRERAAASHVGAMSERILARRFRSTMLKSFKVKDDLCMRLLFSVRLYTTHQSVLGILCVYDAE